MSLKVTHLTFLAQVISGLTNPCILSVLILLLIAFTNFSNVRELSSWIAIILIFFVLIPVVYVYLRAFRSRNRIQSMIDLTIFLKQHPKDILLLALVLGLPCLIILWFLKAPVILISTLVALFAGSMVTALCNIFYRVSFHLTAITILIVMVAQAWGQIFLVLLFAVPLIAWAKYQIRDHTVPQLLIGIASGTVVSLGALYLFGWLYI